MKAAGLREGFLCLLDKQALAINEDDAGAKLLRAAEAGVLARFKGFNKCNILDGDKAFSDGDDGGRVLLLRLLLETNRSRRTRQLACNQSLA